MSQRHTLISSQKCGNKQLWKDHDRLADKEGFRCNVYWVTGDHYCGHWSHNKREGIGIHTYRDGNRYEGEWKNGKREGHGTFWLVDGCKYKVHYKGFWKGDKWHGKGLLYGERGETYEGEFEKGKRHGFGKQTYWCKQSNSYQFYIGEWFNDKREGMGTLYMVNGDRYEGSFMNDMKDGKGVLFFTDNHSKYEGLWNADMPICGSYTRNETASEQGLPLLEILESQLLVDSIINESSRKMKVECHSTSCLQDRETNFHGI